MLRGWIQPLEPSLHTVGKSLRRDDENKIQLCKLAIRLSISTCLYALWHKAERAFWVVILQDCRIARTSRMRVQAVDEGQFLQDEYLNALASIPMKLWR